MSEVTFYDDYSRDRIMTFPEYDRTKLKLDLNPNLPLSSMKRRYLSPAQTNAILQSPDLKLLKLASPELEKLIIQGNGLLTTPTPTGTGSANDVITEEQEQFARGFIEALQKLQNKDDLPSSVSNLVNSSLLDRPAATSGLSSSVSCNSRNGNGLMVGEKASKGRSKARSGSGVRFINTPRTTSNLAQTTVVSNFASSNLLNNNTQQFVQSSQPSNFSTPTGISSSSSIISTSSLKLSHPQTSFVQANNDQNVLTSSSAVTDPSLFVYTSSDTSFTEPLTTPVVPKTEEGLQIVPSGALNVPPIDLELQERVKHQRKKLRNRLAAQRCRKRKIEREDELKDRVKELKTQESDLKNIARDLRAQVCELKQKVLQHVNGGCRVIVSQTEN